MMMTDKPVPAPLRDARRIAHDACLTNVDGKGLAGCPRAPRDDEPNEMQHTNLCNRVTAAIIADRAARQPDVARLRELLEEGARLVEEPATESKLRAWALRARKAVPKKPVDEP